MTIFPCELLQKVDLERYVAQHHLRMPRARFTAAPWSLEPEAVDDLLAKIRRSGVPLLEFANIRPYRGVLTGLNEAGRYR